MNTLHSIWSPHVEIEEGFWGEVKHAKRAPDLVRSDWFSVALLPALSLSGARKKPERARPRETRAARRRHGRTRVLFCPTALPEGYPNSSAGRSGAGALAHGSYSLPAGKGDGAQIRDLPGKKRQTSISDPPARRHRAGRADAKANCVFV